jgi:hypothetical protein
MAQVALYIGTKNGKRQLIEEGDPRTIRSKFKLSDGDGFDVLEVFESAVGRSKRKTFKEGRESPAAPTPEPEAPTAPTDEPEQSGEVEQPDIEALKALAAGDGRKAEVKEAKEKLAELGIIV